MPKTADLAEVPEKAPCRVEGETEALREELIAKMCPLIGLNLTREQLVKLSDHKADELLAFEIDKVLVKIAGWKL